MASIINGKLIADSILANLKKIIQTCKRPPCAVFVRVGEDPASVIYVRQKQKVAAEIGIKTSTIELPLETSLEDILQKIQNLNEDPEVDGILVQAPLPSDEIQKAVFSQIDPRKDIDGFHTHNIGLLCQEEEGFVPCTPAGIVELIKSTGESIEGKHVVVLGRSLIVGKPVGLLLLQRKDFANATVTFCHSKTRDLKKITQSADILISAMGKPYFVTADMVKPGSIIIDVGINRIPAPEIKKGYRVVGDVDFEAVSPLVGYITPVPGGVGPMTIAMLMKNTLQAYMNI